MNGLIRIKLIFWSEHKLNITIGYMLLQSNSVWLKSHGIDWISWLDIKQKIMMSSLDILQTKFHQFHSSVMLELEDSFLMVFIERMATNLDLKLNMNQQINIRSFWQPPQNKRVLIIKQKLMFLLKQLVFLLKESSMTSINKYI